MLDSYLKNVKYLNNFVKNKNIFIRLNQHQFLHLHLHLYFLQSL